jgi:nicotinamidase-related amidase
MQTLEGQKLPVPHCIKDTNGWLLNPKIANALKNRNYKTVEKLTFGSTKLPQLIKESIGDNQAEITIIGLCTDICVVSNALLLKANFTDVEIYVDSSCCAGVTPETHNAALEVMKCCQINII